jgi:hypothetical protein
VSWGLARGNAFGFTAAISVCWFVCCCLLQGFTAARLGLMVGSPFEEEEKTGGTIFDRPAGCT